MSHHSHNYLTAMPHDENHQVVCRMTRRAVTSLKVCFITSRFFSERAMSFALLAVTAARSN